jgi:hypothetical protein
MPPIRSESSQKLVNQEGKILWALEDLKNGRVKSIRAAATQYPLFPLIFIVSGLMCALRASSSI